MAYAKINQLLEGQEEAQKTNIFAPQGGGTSQVAGGEAPTGSVQKTGEQQGLPGVGSSGGEGVQASTQPAAQLGGQEVFKRNVGKQQSPKAFEKMGLDLSAAESSLQDEANKYTAGYQAKAQQIKAPDYQQAIKGDKAAKEQVQSFLGSADPTADKFEAKTNVDVIPGLTSALKTGDPSGAVKQYLRGQSGPQYTQSEADLDYSLLAGDPGFKNIMSTLGQRQEALTQRAGSIGGELEAGAAKTLKEQQDAEKLLLRGGLQQQAGTYLPQAEKSLKAERDELTAAQTKAAAAKEAARGKIGQDKSMARFLDEVYGQQVKLPDPGALTAEQFITPEMAQEYANIYELLGETPATALAANTKGFDYAPDYSNLDLFGGVQAKEAAYNTDLDSKINAILGGVRGNLNERQNQYIKGLRDEVLSRDEFKKVGSAPKLFEGVNIGFGAPLTEYDVLSAPEKSQLIDLYQQREIATPSLGGNREREIRYGDELANALRAKINEARAAEQAAPIVPAKPIDITPQTPTGPAPAPRTPDDQIRQQMAAQPPAPPVTAGAVNPMAGRPAPVAPPPSAPLPTPPREKSSAEIAEELRKNRPNLRATPGAINFGF
jgi:hypothetical protein